MKRHIELADGHRISLLQGAAELFPALVRAMDAARADIQFETYIFDCTGAGAQVAEALERAAQRGVRTRLLVDGVGTGLLPLAWRERFDAAGVKYRAARSAAAAALAAPAPKTVRD